MKVLFVTHPYPNYVPDLLLHGLRKVIGPSVVDFPRKDCVYDGVLGLGVCPEDQLCHGWFPADDGMVDREDVWGKVGKGFFDYVVSDVRSLQWLSKHVSHSPKNFIIIDGEDSPTRIRPGPYVVFRRETNGLDPSIPLPMAIPEEIFQWITRYDGTGKEYTIGFLGSSQEGARRNTIERISRYWPDSLLCSSIVPSQSNTTPRGRRGRDEYYRNLQKCHILLSLPGAGYDTFRFWENAACNGVHICKRMPILIPNNFIEGEHIFTFRSVDELNATISKIIEGRNGRSEIVEQARSHLLKFHTTTKRAVYFIDSMKSALGQK